MSDNGFVLDFLYDIKEKVLNTNDNVFFDERI